MQNLLVYKRSLLGLLAAILAVNTFYLVACGKKSKKKVDDIEEKEENTPEENASPGFEPGKYLTFEAYDAAREALKKEATQANLDAFNKTVKNEISLALCDLFSKPDDQEMRVYYGNYSPEPANPHTMEYGPDGQKGLRVIWAKRAKASDGSTRMVIANTFWSIEAVDGKLTKKELQTKGGAFGDAQDVLRGAVQLTKDKGMKHPNEDERLGSFAAVSFALTGDLLLPGSSAPYLDSKRTIFPSNCVECHGRGWSESVDHQVFFNVGNPWVQTGFTWQSAEIFKDIDLALSKLNEENAMMDGLARSLFNSYDFYQKHKGASDYYELLDAEVRRVKANMLSSGFATPRKTFYPAAAIEALNRTCLSLDL